MASLMSRKPCLVLFLGDLLPYLFTGERVPVKYPFPPSCYEKAVSYPGDHTCSLPNAEFPGVSHLDALSTELVRNALENSLEHFRK